MPYTIYVDVYGNRWPVPTYTEPAQPWGGSGFAGSSPTGAEPPGEFDPYGIPSDPGYNPDPMQVPPLVVDVYSGTPEPTESPIGGNLDILRPYDDYSNPYLPGGSLYTAPDDFVSSVPIPTGPETPPIIPGGTVPDFPSLRDFFNFGMSAIQGFQQQPEQRPTLRVQSAAACMPGYHLRKTQPKPRVRPVQQCVKRRSMNTLNPHALRRATRRLGGFFNHVKSAQKAVRHALSSQLPHTSRRGVRGGCFTCGARTKRSCTC